MGHQLQLTLATVSRCNMSGFIIATRPPFNPKIVVNEQEKKKETK